MAAMIHDKDLMLNITGKHCLLENSRVDFYNSKIGILEEKKKSSSRFPECSVCGKVKSKLLMMNCLHPICVICAYQQYKEPKDIKCQDCNTFMHLLNKLRFCMAEIPQISLKAEADKIIEEEKKKAKGMVVDISRLNTFDTVSDEVTKVGSAYQFHVKCENMVVSGNISGLFSKTTRR